MAAGIDCIAADEAKPRSLTVPERSPFLRSLSEEIDVLRKEMEDIFAMSSGFQSEELLAASQKLDLKINQYLSGQLS